MYDINKLRDELKSKPIQFELLNEIHKQIVSAHYANCIIINLLNSKKYSSKVKKTIVTMLGYKIVAKKIANEFVIIKRKSSKL